MVYAPPRGRGDAWGKVGRIPLPWEGEGKLFTKDFEAFALALMRELPMKPAGEILGAMIPGGGGYSWRKSPKPGAEWISRTWSSWASTS